MIRRAVLLTGTSLAFLAVTSAKAATAADAPPNTIEEVVVTAQKVQTNLQKTPLAVTSISSATLESEHIVAPKDLDNIVPGLVVNTTPSNPLSISIRAQAMRASKTPPPSRACRTIKTASILRARSR